MALNKVLVFVDSLSSVKMKNVTLRNTNGGQLDIDNIARAEGLAGAAPLREQTILLQELFAHLIFALMRTQSISHWLSPGENNALIQYFSTRQRSGEK